MTKLIKQHINDHVPIEKQQTKEINRGRKECRILSLYEPEIEWTRQYPGLKKIICVRRIRKTKRKESDTTHYYISSLESNDPNLYLDLIRKHWWIENKLHYVKDVVLREDLTSFETYSRIKKNAVYRNIAINCLKLNGFLSIKQGLEKCANNVKLCIKLLRT